MVYIFAFVGFVMGFGVGLGVINVLLRNRSLKDIQNDKSLRFRSGLAVWVFAGLGGWAGVWLYNYNFL